MGKSPEITERERRLTEVVAEQADAFAMGVCEGLAAATMITIRHRNQPIAVALAARGRRIYGSRFEAELKRWRIEITEAGEIRIVDPKQKGPTEGDTGEAGGTP